MGWKSEIKLSDLEPERQIEVTCRRCGKMRYERAGTLATRLDIQHAYLDEVERSLKCRDKYCKGAVRLTLVYHEKMEGFVGGMA